MRRAGTITELKPEPVVKCGRGALALLEVQAPGRRRMAAADFMRGRRVRRGQRGSAHEAAGARPRASRRLARRRRVLGPADSRRTALEVLVRVARERGFADVLLGHRAGRLSPRPTAAWSRSWCSARSHGKGRLDYELERVSSRALDTLAPEILAVLRMALFQLRILTRIPPHAAVDTAVTLARECAGDGRGALRQRASCAMRCASRSHYPHAIATKSRIWRWSIRIRDGWWNDLSNGSALHDAEALMAANNQAAPNVPAPQSGARRRRRTGRPA